MFQKYKKNLQEEGPEKKVLVTGQIVTSKKTRSLGMLLKRSDIHESFWKVFSQGKITDWHISNIEENKINRVYKRDI